ncbi:MAG: antitoxin [Acidimicrobiia bacterium]
MDDIKNKVRDTAEQHGDKIEEGIDRAREMADEKTGGKHTDKIDKAAQKGKDAIQNMGR